MEAFNEYLKQFPGYTPQAFAAVQPLLKAQHLAPREYFLQEGRVCRNIAFIEAGLLRLYYLQDGKEVTNCFCKAHSITGSYRSLITQQASDLAIQAIEPSKLWVLSYEALQQLYLQEPFWQQVGRLAAENEFMTTESHNRFLRDLSATERYRKMMAEDGELLQRVPLNHVATYLQVSPETLSRIRKKITRT